MNIIYLQVCGREIVPAAGAFGDLGASCLGSNWCRFQKTAFGQKLPFTFFVVGASLLAKSFIALFASEERLGVPLAPKKM
ncbi:MAG: hypothetical protein CMK95_00805 [Pseudomonas sp.]|nr:hypothetical protein [Pseudomonas sp.]HBM09503.1 hypothetical protein [Pseudomonas sp.]